MTKRRMALLLGCLALNGVGLVLVLGYARPISATAPPARTPRRRPPRPRPDRTGPEAKPARGPAGPGDGRRGPGGTAAGPRDRIVSPPRRRRTSSQAVGSGRAEPAGGPVQDRSGPAGSRRREGPSA